MSNSPGVVWAPVRCNTGLQISIRRELSPSMDGVCLLLPPGCIADNGLLATVPSV